MGRAGGAGVTPHGGGTHMAFGGQQRIGAGITAPDAPPPDCATAVGATPDPSTCATCPPAAGAPAASGQATPAPHGAHGGTGIGGVRTGALAAASGAVVVGGVAFADGVTFAGADTTET